MSIDLADVIALWEEIAKAAGIEEERRARIAWVLEKQRERGMKAVPRKGF